MKWRKQNDVLSDMLKANRLIVQNEFKKQNKFNEQVELIAQIE